MERKIYLYDRGFWVFFRMLGIFAAAIARLMRSRCTRRRSDRRNEIVRIPCSFTKQGGEIRAYFAGVYVMEEVR